MQLAGAIKVKVGKERWQRCACARLAIGAFGDVFGGDQVLEGRQAHVGDVHTAEEPVPVAIIRLATVQVILGGESFGPCWHGGHLGAGAQHLLMQIIDLGVLHLEVAPESSAQVSRFRALGILRRVQHWPKDLRLFWRQHPIAHLGVGRGRQIDAADRSALIEPTRWRCGGEPVGVLLESGEELLDPRSFTPAVVPGGWPRAELLTVVTHRADALTIGRGVLAQILDHAFNRSEWDAIAQTLLRAEHGEWFPLIFGEVGTPERIFGNGGGAKVGVIEDRPAVATVVQRCGE